MVAEKQSEQTEKQLEMSGDRYKPPPPYTEGTSYEVWKNDIQLWAEFTTLEKKRQGTALYLELTGKVKECVRTLGNEILMAEDGLKKIIEHLDKIYKKDAGRIIFQIVERFEQFERTPNSSNLGIQLMRIGHGPIFSKLPDPDPAKNRVPHGWPDPRRCLNRARSPSSGHPGPPLGSGLRTFHFFLKKM